MTKYNKRVPKLLLSITQKIFCDKKKEYIGMENGLTRSKKATEQRLTKVSSKSSWWVIRNKQQASIRKTLRYPISNTFGPMGSNH